METTTQAAQPATLNMIKGQNLNVTKGAPGANEICLGLGWEAKGDLDAFALVLNKDGKTIVPGHVLYFNSNVQGYNGKTPIWIDDSKPYPYILNGAVKHSGDKLDGAAEGDDETITVLLDQLVKEFPDAQKVLFGANIFEAATQKLNFGQVQNAYVRIYDGANAADKADTTKGLGRYDLSEDFATATCVIFGEMYLKEGDWKFKAIGEAKTGELPDIVQVYS